MSNNHKIWTVEVRGWREVYEIMPNGDKILLWSNSDKIRRTGTDATAATETEEMPWAEFCKRYRDNPQYARPTDN